ncbi:MAG: hypothetical protein KC492_28490, partial [Myxococcales bacterium]|nr:hypothetical protein [Myxococcales bacterium]
VRTISHRFAPAPTACASGGERRFEKSRCREVVPDKAIFRAPPVAAGVDASDPRDRTRYNLGLRVTRPGAPYGAYDSCR